MRTERAKPLLGTVVRVRVDGLAERDAHAAIEAAFAEIAQIHALMSFHEAASDVSRLNRTAHREAVTVDARTNAVLQRALEISALSDGAFDVTVAPQLVAAGHLPAPDDVVPLEGSWRDIALLPGNRVQFRKPLWIDLGGIAKGYAVDCAIEVLSRAGVEQACVNAGGDLRVIGAETERILLTPEHADSEAMPVIELRDGALASSSGAMGSRRVHVGTRETTVQFVSVMAARCMDADALTKVVMAGGACSLAALEALGARAVIHDAQNGWRQIG